MPVQFRGRAARNGDQADQGELIHFAIVDGINLFVRTALKEKGLICPESFAQIGNREILDLKYKIANDLASAWVKMPMKD
jgi:hypothetical protein